MKVEIVFKDLNKLLTAIETLKAYAETKIADTGETTSSDAGPSDDTDFEPTETDFEGSQDFDTSFDEDGELPEKKDVKKAPPEKKETTTTKGPSAADVNKAAMAHAGKHGRANTSALLNKHFKVKHPNDIKPKDYAQAIKVLKV